jgi:hypothetical protein
MAENCKNCDKTITGSFCSNCGQKKYNRIDKKYIWDEIQYTVLHTNKGFLYSVNNILKNPGKTAKDYIDGNRVSHYKPILLVFVLSGLSAFLSYKVLNLNEVMSAYFSQQNINSNSMGDVNSFLSSYNSVIMLLLIPLFALTTKIAFKKWGNNYYEHVVMNAYVLSFYTLISIILVFPIMFIFRHSPNTFFNITQLSLLLVPAILIWFFKEFYKDKPLKSIILKVLGVLGLTVLGLLFVIILVSIISIGLTILK